LNKVGILVNNLGRNQLAHGLIHSVNNFLEGSSDTDIIIFAENVVHPCSVPKFAVMNLNEAWEYDGLIISTSLSTAEKSLLFPGARRRLFYVWDMEWMRVGDGDFDYFQSIYGNPKLDLIARSDTYAKIIERCWNRPVKAVVENCDVGELIRYGQTKN
jgi:hypothetical protein